MGTGISAVERLIPKFVFNVGGPSVNILSNVYPTTALQQADARHHWHPFTDTADLAAKGDCETSVSARMSVRTPPQ